jgi:hypothetical protein
VGPETKCCVAADYLDDSFYKGILRKAWHEEPFHRPLKTAGILIRPENGESPIFLGQGFKAFKTTKTILGCIINKGHIGIKVARSRKTVPFSLAQAGLFIYRFVGFFQVLL